MKCTIEIKPRDTRTHWIVIETKEFAILQIRSKECFFIPLETSKGELAKTQIDGELFFDLIIRDKWNYKQIYEKVNRRTIKKKQYISFCKLYGTPELINKFDNYFRLCL